MNPSGRITMSVLKDSATASALNRSRMRAAKRERRRQPVLADDAAPIDHRRDSTLLHNHGT